ncbi:MAG: recombination mediator RecR [Bacilli bacterium]|nr:recombination mediator RecR [Bacilli bacterium]
MKELKALDRLTESFRKLPSVGQRSAERFAYAVLSMDNDTVDEFMNALKNVKEKIHKCPICGLYTENDVCEVCSSNGRNHDTLIVVTSPKDVVAFEKLDGFNGVYHVLNGSISAINGVGINDLNIDSLFPRIEKENIKEIIIATDPTIEGETTALYLAKLLEKYNVEVTRLAYGLPMGGQLDYADAMTLNKALQGRTNLKK